MIDRHGNVIIIGWSAPECLWLEAAISLPRSEHTAAFQDIADMTGRSLHAVRSRAYKILQDRLDAKIAERAAFHKAQHEAMMARRAERRAGYAAMAPSQIAPVSKAKLMGARA